MTPGTELEPHELEAALADWRPVRSPEGFERER